MKRIKFIINGKEFPATLNDSDAAGQLYYLLPLDVPFTEKGGYEYYCALEDDFTSQPVKSDFEKAGNLNLYLSNYVAIFYKDIVPTLVYTPLGQLDSTDGLKEALDAGYQSITIERIED